MNSPKNSYSVDSLRTALVILPWQRVATYCSQHHHVWSLKERSKTLAITTWWLLECSKIQITRCRTIRQPSPVQHMEAKTVQGIRTTLKWSTPVSLPTSLPSKAVATWESRRIAGHAPVRAPRPIHGSTAKATKLQPATIVVWRALLAQPRTSSLKIQTRNVALAANLKLCQCQWINNALTASTETPNHRKAATCHLTCTSILLKSMLTHTMTIGPKHIHLKCLSEDKAKYHLLIGRIQVALQAPRASPPY